MIGDATGHGVPSALITATAASCCSTLEKLSGQGSTILKSPSTFLTFLNNAVYASGKGKILMSFFAAYFDVETATMTYSSAGHVHPILCRAEFSKQLKKNFIPLKNATGSLLGLKANEEFEETSIAIASGDMVAMYTDGLTDLQNSKGKPWGTRHFLESLGKHSHLSSLQIRNGVIKDAYAHLENGLVADDVTFVVTKIK